MNLHTVEGANPAMVAEVKRLMGRGEEEEDREEEVDASGMLMLKEPVPPVITFMEGLLKEGGKGYHRGVWSEEQDMKTLRHKMAHPDFMKSWELVIKAYLDGEWKDCIKRIKSFQEMYGKLNDGRRMDLLCS